MEKNDKYKIMITNLDHQGRGIGRINEKIVFVPFSLPNEEVDIKLTKIKKNFLEGELINVLSTNDSRIEPICPYFKICGGCDLQHLSYDEQLKFKEEKIKNIITKYVGNYEIDSIIPSKDIYNYRNKITFQINNYLGFFGKKSYDFIKVDKCFLANNNINQYIEIINKLDLNCINQVVIRSNLKGEILIIFELNNLIDENKLIKLFENTNVSVVTHFKNKYKTLIGNNFLIEEIGDLKFIISPSSFFQVNTKQTFNLYNKVLEYSDLTKNEFVLDLYCGTGTIGLFLSRFAKKVIGIEINNDAIIDANKNKKLNNIENCEFISGDVSKIITEKNYNPDVIVVDPPRSGLDNNTINQIIRFKSKKIVYVSCDPMTLARDLKLLSEYYDIKKITPVDMFPNTYHVESVVLLDKK